MKIKKLFLIIIGVLFFLVLIGSIVGIVAFNNLFFKEVPNYLSIDTDYEPIKFWWAETEVNGHIIEKSAMMIHAKVKEAPHKFYFQFDTGHSATVIYDKTLASLKNLGLEINEIVRNDKRYVEELSVNLGGSQVTFKMLEIHEDHGMSFNEKDSLGYFSLGTIGSDFIATRITEIDFHTKAIKFHEQRQDWMTKDSEFTPFDFAGKKLMLPCVIDNKKYNMYYDSGCSSFGLMTTKGEYKEFSSPSTKEISYTLFSWGKADRWQTAVELFQNATDKRMLIAGFEIDVKRVTYVNVFSNLQGMIKPFTKIDGWLGNVPFLEYSLIFDAPKQEFVILKKQ